MGTIGQERAAEQIRSILSSLLLMEMNDPRVQGVTITDVKVDRESAFADVYVHALGDDSREKDVIKALGRASGFMRRELSKRMRSRTIPRLHFHWDPTLRRAEKINALLDDLDIPTESND